MKLDDELADVRERMVVHACQYLVLSAFYFEFENVDGGRPDGSHQVWNCRRTHWVGSRALGVYMAVEKGSGHLINGFVKRERPAPAGNCERMKLEERTQFTCNCGKRRLMLPCRVDAVTLGAIACNHCVREIRIVAQATIEHN